MPTIDHPTLGRIAYSTSGEGPTALVLMHGWAGSGSYFDLLISHLDPDLVYCVSLDLPGHGSSAEPTAPYSLDQITDATIAVADAVGADTFVLLGFSMSAKFAQHVSLRHPDRVLGQVLVAGCPTGRLPLPAELIEDWCARAGDPERLLEVVLSCATRPIPGPVLDAVGRAAGHVSRQVLQETVDLCAASDFSAEVAGSPLPTLVVGGTDDWLFTPETLREGVVGPLGGAELQLLDCGHEVPTEAPEELARLITRFVTEVRRTDRSAPSPARRGG
jgi:pimeloyl-ACP methyl ester carboxylesterase